jgi:hypothetical protein
MASDSNSKKDDKETKEAAALKHMLGDTVKKVFTAGVSAAFMTEESLRAYLAELKLPKEVYNMLIQSANKSKDEITQRVGKEVIGIVQKIDFVKEFSKFAETHKFKITAEIDIIKKDPVHKEPSKTNDEEKI